MFPVQYKNSSHLAVLIIFVLSSTELLNMPSSVVYLKLWSMKASSRVEADSSVGEMESEEPQVVSIVFFFFSVVMR